ncbi:MAG TPA: nucleotide exchange factor GrpE [Patescibacteria group bacterium]|nr:nucleotide exchange factor GrpE [Patescibacteria group bacterium]
MSEENSPGNPDQTPPRPRDAEDDAHDKRMADLFGDLDDGDDFEETIDDMREERDELKATVERLKSAVSRTRADNQTLVKRTEDAKAALADIDTLIAQDKKEIGGALLRDLLPTASSLQAGLNEIDAAERAANPKLDKLTKGVESTLSQLTAVFNKYGVKAGDDAAPASAAKEPAAKNEAPAVASQAPKADENASPVVKSEETFESVKAERDALNAEVVTLTGTVQRAQSDNLVLSRRLEENKSLLTRNEQKREGDKLFAAEKTLKEIMPVIDTLELGLQMIDKKTRDADPNFDALAKVVEDTLGGVKKVFNKYGIVQIDPKGEPFDMEKHEAVTLQAVPGVEAEMVVHVAQKGYELNGRMVRNAKVVVTPPEM